MEWSILDYMKDERLIENIRLVYLESFDLSYNDPKTDTDILCTIHKLLEECVEYHQDMTYVYGILLQKADYALSLIKQYKFVNIDLYCQGFVYFPVLLKEYIDFQQELGGYISIYDLESMFCRCIESFESFAPDSIQYLIELKGEMELEIKLLPEVYHINKELYECALAHGVRDSHYNNISNLGIPGEYLHPDIVFQYQNKPHTGFRDAYHILMYGNAKHLQSLIVNWDIWGVSEKDETITAARKFFRLDSNCPLSLIKEKINIKCQ